VNIGPASSIWYGTLPSEKLMTEEASCPGLSMEKVLSPASAEAVVTVP
jgi:hypothetical protein